MSCRSWILDATPLPERCTEYTVSQSVTLLFMFNGVFWWSCFNSVDIKLINYQLTNLFCFHLCSLYLTKNIFCLTLDYGNKPLCIFSRSLILLVFTFSLWLASTWFLCILWEKGRDSFVFIWISSCFKIIHWEDISFPLELV